jgi:hypothetical protein
VIRRIAEDCSCLQRFTLVSATGHTSPIVWSYCLLCHRTVTVELVWKVLPAFRWVTNRVSESYFVTCTSQVGNAIAGRFALTRKPEEPSGSVVDPWLGPQDRKTKRQLAVADDYWLGLGCTAFSPTVSGAAARLCHSGRFFGSRHYSPAPAGWSAAADLGWRAVLPAPPRASSCRTLSAVNGLPRGV